MSTSPGTDAGPPVRSRPPVRWLARLASSVAVRLALLAFVVYNVNLRAITSYDTYPARLLPISILTEFDLDLDEFAFLREARFARSADSAPNFMSYRRDHWMSMYPVMPAVLATPVYAIPIALGLHRGPPIAPGLSRAEVVGTLLSKLAASLAAAASVVFTYLTLTRFVPIRTAVVLTLIYAFATSTWSVTSQGLWQTAFSQPAFALALLAFVRARERDAARWLAVAGLALALSVACRPPMAVVALVLSVYVLLRHRQHLAHFVVAPIALGALLLAYNFYYFGTATGGYSGALGGSHDFSLSNLQLGLRGLLISPNRGLLVFSPILLPSFAGMWLVLSTRAPARDRLLAAVALGTLLAIVQYAAYSVWHGAFGYSYRFLAELLPAFVLLLVPVWERLVATAARRVVVTAVVGYSLAVQVVGVFYYPCGWYQSPPADDAGNVSRFFSWRELEVRQCIAAGPVDPDGLRAIRRALGIPGSGREAR